MATTAPAREHVPSGETFRVAFIHPDLGIGGAERLVVDAAVGLQELGHEAEVITSHHDPSHCFEPTRDGTIKVHVAKTYLPRHIKGALHLPMAIARQYSLLFQLLVALFAFHFPGSIPSFIYRRLTSLPPLQEYDVFIVDQLSACVPFLRIFTATRVIFYCHFPDKDVGTSIARQKAIERGQSGPGLLRFLYRVPFDMLEEMTMSTSDKILVNSEFTSRQFQKSFHRLARIPRVVYPGIDLNESSRAHVEKAVRKLEADEEREAGGQDGSTSIKRCIRTLIESNDRPTLISINRFEAKKNVGLALDTFIQVQKEYAAGAAGAPAKKLRLVLAGGYDHRLQDNILTLKELQTQCDKQGVPHLTLYYNKTTNPDRASDKAPSASDIANASVIFLPSVPYALLTSLLMHESSRALLYTPTEEHFGIVPLEAMAVGLPVLATNSGGPMESVLDLQVEVNPAASSSDAAGLQFSNADGTGLLRRASPKLWTEATLDLLRLSDAQRARLAENARARVQSKFSRRSMSTMFEQCIWETRRLGSVRPEEGLLQWSIATGMFILMSCTFLVVLRKANARQAEVLRTIKHAEAKLHRVQSEIAALGQKRGGL